MNGSKTVLLLAILVMALAPWALIFQAIYSEDGSFLSGKTGSAAVDVDEIRREEAIRHEGVIERLEKQTALLEKEVSRLEAELEKAPRDEEAVAELRRKTVDLRERLDEEREERIRALEEVARLRADYDSAMGEIVRLKTETAPSPPKQEPAETPSPDPQPGAPEAAAPNTGGWILPPSN